MGMGLATTFVMTMASICAWLIDTWILIPLDMLYLRTLSFILVIAVVVQFTEMVVRKTSPALYRLLGIFLPLITTNCAVLGVALLNINLGIISCSRRCTVFPRRSVSLLLWSCSRRFASVWQRRIFPRRFAVTPSLW